MANLLESMRKSSPPPGPTGVGATASSQSAVAHHPAAHARPIGAEGHASGSQTSTRTLVVGREIVLSGEISACDRLVVEGTVKANIKDCKDIAIAEGGLFTGSASVESAEIRGRFEGELTVSGRLFIRTPGEVAATVRYREIEIERGGRLSGTVTASDAAKPASFKAAV